MEEKFKYLNDDYIYSSDGEKKLDYVIQVDDILGGYFKNDNDTYFNLMDYHYEFECHEKIHLNFLEIIVDCTNFLCVDIDNFKDEFFFLTYFQHIFSL